MVQINVIQFVYYLLCKKENSFYLNLEYILNYPTFIHFYEKKF